MALPVGTTLILAARAVGIDRHMDSRQAGSDACGAWIFQHSSGFNKLIYDTVHRYQPAINMQSPHALLR